MSYYKFKYEASSPYYDTVSFEAEDINEARQHFDKYLTDEYPELYDIEILEIEEVND